MCHIYFSCFNKAAGKINANQYNNAKCSNNATDSLLSSIEDEEDNFNEENTDI